MPIQIGERGPGDDFVELLSGCHRRIRDHLGLAGRVAAAREERPDPEAVAKALGRVRRYFEEALPLHRLDEEESLLPRLRGREEALDAALAVMEQEHQEHEAGVASLVALSGAVAEAPERLAALGAALEAQARALEGAYAVHLAAEEALVFPALRRLLSEEEQRACVRELRRRRRVPRAM